MTHTLTVWRGERLVLDRKPFDSLADARTAERTYARDPKNLVFLIEGDPTPIFRPDSSLFRCGAKRFRVTPYDNRD